MIIGQTVWDGLLFRNLDTGEYEPLLATGYKWIDNTTIESTTWRKLYSVAPLGI